ncbi:MAG: ABC transporter ATP-binding protein [Ignavibacteria bacterium]|nr:ABC transporter ATP-binding protein [Ignavibacteria bacterium]
MIELININFSYPESPNKFILQDINLKLDKSKFSVILGPNGSGKTTLIKLIARLLKPTSGRIFLDNIPIEKISLKEFYRRVSYVPQKFFSIYPYTVFEIVLMGRSLNFNFLGFESRKDLIKVNEILEQLEISHLAKKRIDEISGGELQKVILARSIAQEADILLLDEPNTHLDIKHQIQIFDLLSSLKSKGKTIIAVSHDINIASFYADNLIFIKDGKIRYEGDIKSVLREEIIEEIFEVENKVLIDNEKNIPQLIINPLRKNFE